MPGSLVFPHSSRDEVQGNQAWFCPREASSLQERPISQTFTMQCDRCWHRAGGRSPGDMSLPRLLGRWHGRSPSSRLSFEEVEAMRE